MTYVRRGVSVLLVVMMAAVAFAQGRQQNEGSGSCANCLTVRNPDGSASNQVRCFWANWLSLGWTECTQHNAPTGPGWCEFGGQVCGNQPPPITIPEDTATLAALIGDDEASALLDEIAMRTLGMAPDARMAEESRLLRERLDRFKLANGVPLTSRIVVPTRTLDDPHVVIPRTQAEQP